MTPKKVVPLIEGLFKLPSSPTEKAYLIGSKCKRCGEVFFPQRAVCLCCGSINSTEEIALSSKGKLYTYAICRQAPPNSVVVAPYALAHIGLPEGITVETVLADCDFGALKLGMDMELVIEKVKQDEEGNDVAAFKFKPIHKRN